MENRTKTTEQKKKSNVGSISIINRYFYTNKVAQDVKWDENPKKKEIKEPLRWDNELDFFFSVLGYAGKINLK